MKGLVLLVAVSLASCASDAKQIEGRVGNSPVLIKEVLPVKPVPKEVIDEYSSAIRCEPNSNLEKGYVRGKCGDCYAP